MAFHYELFCVRLQLGRSELKFILVGIGGEDLHRGNVTLTLGLVWQVMRAYTLTMLASLMQKTGFGGSTLEKDIIDWANSKLRAAKKPRTVSGFQDLDLSDGRILLDLIEAIRPRSVKSEWVKSGYSDAVCFLFLFPFFPIFTLNRLLLCFFTRA